MKYLSDVILLLIELAGRNSQEAWFRGITRLEKIIFILMSEHGLSKWIEEDKPKFIPYKLGPYSREVYAAIDFLGEYGLVEDSFSNDNSSLDSMEAIMSIEHGSMPYEERRFRLTPDGKKAAQALRNHSAPETLAAIENTYRTFGDIPLIELLRHVYTKYPNYTGKSVIKHDILPNNSIE